MHICGLDQAVPRPGLGRPPGYSSGRRAGEAWRIVCGAESAVVAVLDRVTEQDRMIADVRDANARLKGLNGRPQIKPSRTRSVDDGLPSRHNTREGLLSRVPLVFQPTNRVRC
jgi:hypothetical protein